MKRNITSRNEKSQQENYSCKQIKRISSESKECLVVRDYTKVEWIDLETIDERDVFLVQKLIKEIDEGKDKLRKRYGLPPLNFWNGQMGEEIKRNEEWKQFTSIVGGEGRSETYQGLCWGFNMKSNVSVYPMVEAEHIFKMFCPLNGLVLDPFSGGPERGLVANVMGLKYLGVEIRKEQVLVNRQFEWAPNRKESLVKCSEGAGAERCASVSSLCQASLTQGSMALDVAGNESS